MNKNTGRNRRYLIAKNSILMLVMLVIIFLAIWAWFGAADSAKATGIKAKANPADEIEIAVPEKEVIDGVTTDYFPRKNDSWDYSIQFENTGYLSNLVKDVTSDGKEFIIPGFNSSTNNEIGRTVNKDDLWEKALSSKEVLSDDKPNNDDQYHYVSLDFYLRSRNKKIKLSENSYLAAGSELGIYFDEGEEKYVPGQIKPLVGSGSTVYRQSSYGNFSSDAIVGAMRVSLVGTPVNSISNISGTTNWVDATYSNGQTSWEDAATKRLIWLPRPDLLLNTTDNKNNWTLTTNIGADATNSEKTYYHSFYSPNENGRSYKKGVEKQVYFDSKAKDYTGSDTSYSNPDNFVVSNGSNPGSYMRMGHPVEIANDGTTTDQISFIEGTGAKASRPTTGFYVYKFSLNIWIEGEDEEARRAMSNGLFSLYLEFCG